MVKVACHKFISSSSLNFILMNHGLVLRLFGKLYDALYHLFSRGPRQRCRVLVRAARRSAPPVVTPRGAVLRTSSCTVQWQPAASAGALCNGGGGNQPVPELLNEFVLLSPPPPQLPDAKKAAGVNVSQPSPCRAPRRGSAGSGSARRHGRELSPLIPGGHKTSTAEML
jgi:hypothetical protein